MRACVRACVRVCVCVCVCVCFIPNQNIRRGYLKEPSLLNRLNIFYYNNSQKGMRHKLKNV